MKKKLFALLTAFALCLALASCAEKPADTSRATVRVATLSGPTGLGMAQLFAKDADGSAKNDYEFTVCTDPTEIVGLVANGSVDVAAVPTNLAATLYKKTSGKVRLLGINTLGVLHILDATGTVKSLADLNGKTLYATGEGSTPEFVLDYLLEQNGVDATVVYKAEHSELAALCIGGQADIALLPEPFVTNVTSKTDRFTDVIDLSDEWEKAAKTNLPMGGVIATADFVENHADALDAFLTEYAQSVAFVNNTPKEAGAFAEQYGILPSAAVAEKAIPNCNIVLLTGEKMKEDARTYFAVLLAADPTSVGGSLPEDALYYIK